MSLILKLPQVLQESREAFEKLMDGEDAVPFRPTELVSGGDGIRDPEAAADFNMLALGDNLDFMAYLLKERGMEGKINLIYVDPPFFSKSDYGSDIRLKSDKIEKIPIMRQKAYHDTWENGMEEYLKMLALRFFLMHRLLAGDGSLFVHLDWHAVHYVKILLDEIFGAKNFVNEVIWQYKSGGASRRCFARKHDNLLFYGKTRNYYFKPMQEKSYNRGFKPYRFKGVKEYRDETGWYTMVNRKDV